MRFIIQDSKEEIAKTAADMVELAVRENPHGVLGLATGSSPVGLYKELIKRSEAGLDFSGISSLNLDEYIGLNGYHEQSYRYFMKQHLFDGINIDQKNTQVPRGDMPDTEAEAKRYEDLIQTTEPAMIQILGIGGNGHIGFNEPKDHFQPGTHLVDLHPLTIQSNSRYFEAEEHVPTKAISVGIKTILQSRMLVLLANGEEKAEAVYKTIRGKVCPEVPSSILQLHSNAILILEKNAAKLL